MKNVICRRVIDVTEEGITLESDAEKIYIDFKDCVKNFSSEVGKIAIVWRPEILPHYHLRFILARRPMWFSKRTFLRN